MAKAAGSSEENHKTFNSNQTTEVTKTQKRKKIGVLLKKMRCSLFSAFFLIQSNESCVETNKKVQTLALFLKTTNPAFKSWKRRSLKASIFVKKNYLWKTKKRQESKADGPSETDHEVGEKNRSEEQKGSLASDPQKIPAQQSNR